MRTILQKARIEGVLVFIVILITAGCASKQSAVPPALSHLIDSIGIVWVPDLREGIFDAQLTSSGSELVLRGETTVPEAKNAITDILKQTGVPFLDGHTVLPEQELSADPWGLVNVSVCNIRFTSSYDAEMVSQALMGTPVKIFKKENGWLLIQTPDMYLGWVDSDAIALKPRVNTFCGNRLRGCFILLKRGISGRIEQKRNRFPILWPDVSRRSPAKAGKVLMSGSPTDELDLSPSEQPSAWKNFRP